MARRIKETPSEKVTAWKVEEHDFSTSRTLIEIGPGDPWNLFEQGKFKVDARVKDALVKVTPPSTATDDTIEKLRAVLMEAGAFIVRVMPRPKGMVVPSGVEVKTNKPAHRSVREVVKQLVAEANTRNRDALHTVVEATMSKVGL